MNRTYGKIFIWLMFLLSIWTLIYIKEYAFILAALSTVLVMSEIEKSLDKDKEELKRKGIETFLNEVIRKNSNSKGEK